MTDSYNTLSTSCSTLDQLKRATRRATAETSSAPPIRSSGQSKKSAGPTWDSPRPGESSGSLTLVESGLAAPAEAAAGAPGPQAGQRTRRLSWLWGPAFVAAIAYVDPGNVAANLTAGAQYGYLLVWVLALANGMAVLVQYLSAKAGLVTGRSLPDR